MKTILFILTLSITLSIKIAAQHLPCSFDYMELNSNQSYIDGIQQFDDEYLNWMQGAPHINNSYEIPVVFHIMHNNGAENISDSQVLQALDQLNSQFAGDEGGFDTRIRFILASIDPFGSCSFGIDHLQTPHPFGSTFQYTDYQLKDLDRWDPSRYVNIWIVKGGGFDQAGYSYLPPVDESVDGIVVQYDYLGTTGAATGNDENVLSHEMGHYLGLYHVWGFNEKKCENCHDESEDLTAGDKVADTNPCYERIITDCDPLLTQCNACPFDPKEEYPKDNYMSYSSSCQNKFTQGQAERMWFSLETYRQNLWSESNKLCSGIKGHFVGDVTISNSTNWNTGNLPNSGDVIISGSITIENGGTLTVGSGVTLRFCKDAKIVVKQGGTYITQAAHTSACNEPWQGIEVWGDSHVAQGNILSHPSQGFLIMRDGSKIEMAKVGIRLYGYDYLNTGGGIISCIGTEFRNLGTAVQFAPYDIGGDYKASFSKCSFYSDGSSLPFYAFLDLDGVKGVHIIGCDFDNESEYVFNSIDSYGYGIYAKDSGFKLSSKFNYDINGNYISTKKCTFNGLGYGIYITHLLGNRPCNVEQGEFSNCFFGVYDNGMSYITLLYNDFKLGEVPNSLLINDGDAQIGVDLESSINGFIFEENKFGNPTNSTLPTLGTHCKNIGYYGNNIRKNTFDKITIANNAEGYNFFNQSPGLGLKYLCNTVTNSSTFDFSVSPSSTSQTSGIHINQGVPDPTDQSADPIWFGAGNKFAYNSYAEGDFYICSSCNSLKYHYYHNGSNETPIDFTTSRITLKEAKPPQCLTTYCEPVCVEPAPPDMQLLKAAFQNYRDDYLDTCHYYFGINSGNITTTFPANFQTRAPYNTTTNAIAQNNRLESWLQYNLQEINRIAKDAIMALLSDTSNINYTEYLWWLGQINTYESDIVLANEYGRLGQWSNANAIMNFLPTKWSLHNSELAEHNLIQELYGIIQSGMYNLNESQIQRLEDIYDLNEKYASPLANSILAENNRNIPVKYNLPDFIPIEERSIETSNLGGDVNVYPNPSSGKIKIDWKNHDDQQIEFTLYNMVGQRVMTKNILNNVEIDLNIYTNGIYIFTLKDLENKYFSGKISLF